MSRVNQKEKRSTLDRLMDDRDPVETRRNKDRMLLAVRIAELIKARGYSKTAFADLMGRQPSVVSKWLSGAHNLTTDTVSEIAFKLETTFAELVSGQVQKNAVVGVYKHDFAITGASVLPASRMYGGGPSITLSEKERETGMLDALRVTERLGENTLLLSEGAILWENVGVRNYDISGLNCYVTRGYHVERKRAGKDIPKDSDYDFKV